MRKLADTALLVWVDTRPSMFYGVMFLCFLDVSIDFTVSKTIIHCAGLLAKDGR